MSAGDPVCAVHGMTPCRCREFPRTANWDNWYVPMRGPSVCPLCGGSGYRGYFGKETRPLDGTGCYENCHGCAGKGWV